DIGRLADIAAHPDRAHAEPLEVGSRLLAALGLAGAEDEVRPGLGKPGCHLAADAAAAAGDDPRPACEIEQFRRLHSTNSAIVRSVAGSCAWINSVVTPDSFHASSRSAIRSRGPTSATSSTRASGTAAIASIFFPLR